MTDDEPDDARDVARRAQWRRLPGAAVGKLALVAVAAMLVLAVAYQVIKLYRTIAGGSGPAAAVHAPGQRSEAERLKALERAERGLKSAKDNAPASATSPPSTKTAVAPPPLPLAPPPAKATAVAPLPAPPPTPPAEPAPAAPKDASDCKSRIEAAVARLPGDQVEDATDHIKRDCDAAYAERAAACDAKFQQLLSAASKIDPTQSAAETTLAAMIDRHKADCMLMKRQRGSVATLAATLSEQAETARRALDPAALAKLQSDAVSERRAGRHASALDLARRYLAAAEAYEAKSTGAVGEMVRGALIDLSFIALFSSEFSQSLAASERALALRPGELLPETNRAHALMFIGQVDAARALYLAHRGKPLGQFTWNSYILDDFRELRAANLGHPLMTQIAGSLEAPSPPPAASAPQPPPQPATFRTYDNYDMIGNDLAVLKQVGVEDCANACRGDKRCVAYSYDKWNRWCFTKSGLSELVLTARSQTSLRGTASAPIFSANPITFERFRNKTFPRQASGQLSRSLEHCESLCAQSPACIAATYMKRTGQCVMLPSTSEYFPDPEADSFAKRQAEH